MNNPLSKFHVIDNQSLNDLHHMQLHTAIYQLISASINLGRLGIPREYFLEYQQLVICELRFTHLSLVSNLTEQISRSEWLDLRSQTDNCFNTIRACIQSTFEACTDVDDEEAIENLIWQINRMIMISCAKGG